MTQDKGQVPAIQRYKIGYHADEWGQRSSTPSGIPDASGSWVRYEDHVTALTALAAPAQSGLTDAYAGAREDLSIWKRRALEAERDLRSEKQTTSRLVGELNAASGPTFMGDPASDKCHHGDTHIVHDCLRCGAPVCCGKCCAAEATQKLKEQICISDTNQSAACAAGSVGTTSDAQTTRSTHDAPATQQVGEVVAYLDIGAGGYLDLGSTLSDEALQQVR